MNKTRWANEQIFTFFLKKGKKITFLLWKCGGRFFEEPEEKEPLCSLVTQQLILLDPSPNGSRVNRLRRQWVFVKFPWEASPYSEHSLDFQRGVEKCNERDGSSVTFAPVTPQPLLCGSTADPVIKAGAKLSFLFFSFLYFFFFDLFDFFFFLASGQQVVCSPPSGSTVEILFRSVQFGFFLWRCLMLVLLPTLRWFFGSEYKCELLPRSVVRQLVAWLIFFSCHIIIRMIVQRWTPSDVLGTNSLLGVDKSTILINCSAFMSFVLIDPLILMENWTSQCLTQAGEPLMFGRSWCDIFRLFFYHFL